MILIRCEQIVYEGCTIFAKVLYFAELPGDNGIEIPAAVIKPYGKLIVDLYKKSEHALEACDACTSQEIVVVPLQSITSVICMFDFPRGPPGSTFTGERLCLPADILFGVPDEALEEE
jgi:hypothetical protein